MPSSSPQSSLKLEELSDKSAVGSTSGWSKIRQMIPRAKRPIAQIALVHKLLNMYHRMHHDMEALNTVRVFTPSSDKTMTVVVLCAPVA